MTSKTHKTNTSPALAALAELTPAEVSALVVVARERAAAIDDYRARQEKERQWDAHFSQRLLDNAREREEKAARIEEAEKAADALVSRPVRPGDDVLAHVRELIATARVLDRTLPAHAALAKRAHRLAVVAVAAGASELAAQEALGVRDYRRWAEVHYANLTAPSDAEFAEFLESAKESADA